MNRKQLFSTVLLIFASVFLGARQLEGGILPASSPVKAGGLDISLDFFAQGLSSPVGLVNAGDNRLFAIEKSGRVRIIRPDGSVDATPFLNISSRVDNSWSETGLLGIAFHPNYATNGYFYLQYTHLAGSIRYTRLSRFSVTADPDVADPNSENILLTEVQPSWNHNAGGIYFSPTDGYLYIPLGDGGSAGDPSNYAQNMMRLLGKVTRIDVDSGAGVAPDCVGLGTGAYTIPNSNPFIDGAGNSCDEIWAVGLRNPWRGSFDRQTGDLYLGDVGQNAYEEVDFQPAGIGGLNYGWRCYEGNNPYNTSGCAPASSYTFPIFVANQSAGNCSVIGGYVYRGSQYPAMAGHYLASDYCTGHFWDMVPDGSGGWTINQHNNIGPTGQTVAFGEDTAGELYLVSFAGNIYKIKDNSVAPVAGVQLENDGQMQSAVAGTSATFTHTLTNMGNVPDTFTLSTNSAQGWVVSSSPNPTLNAGASTQVTITVTIPAGTAGGTVDSVTLTATSQLDGAVSDSVTDQVTAIAQMAGVTLANDGQSKTGLAGSQVAFVHTLTNTGNIADTFTLSTNSTQGWVVGSSSNPTLNAGTSTQVTMTVTIPAGTSGSTIDTLSLTATSQFDGAVTTSVTDQLEVLTVNYKLWLPLVAK